MSTKSQWVIGLSLFLIFSLSVSAYGHDGSGSGTNHDLRTVPLSPNPNISAFAGVSGKVRLNLAHGVIELEDLKGFPFDTANNRILPITVTSTSDPRLKGHDSEPGETSCEEEAGHWTCHVHSYVVWLAELEDGALGHPIHLGTIYPRTDGTAADRNFSMREGDMTGFGANVVIITAEVSFGALPSILHGHDGGPDSIQLVPLGPIVLQANLSE